MAFAWECSRTEEMQRTGLTGGIVGTRPVVFQWLFDQEWLDPEQTEVSILDFGCGLRALQTRALREMGYNIVGYEPGVEPDDAIDPDALKYQWDIVLVSNVLNIQPTWGCFHLALRAIKRAIGHDGIAVINLPKEPRRLFESGVAGEQQFFDLLDCHFGGLDSESDPLIYLVSLPLTLSMDREREIVKSMLSSGRLTVRGEQ